MVRKLDISTKGRVQQTLKSELADLIVKGARIKANAANLRPTRYEWLYRHIERQHGLCAYCGIRLIRTGGRKSDRRATLDHVVPLACGGSDSEDNTVAACTACNTAKGHLSAQMFRKSPFLAKRKAFVATIPNRPKKTLVVTVVRKRGK